MATAVLDHVKEGAVDTDYLLSMQADALDAMKSITHDATGAERPADQISEADSAAWEVHKKSFETYGEHIAAAKMATKTREQKYRADAMAKFGSDLEVPEPGMQSSTETSRKNASDRAAMRGKDTPFDHMLKSEGFQQLIKQAWRGGRLETAGKSGTFDLGSAQDYLSPMQLKTLVSTQAAADPSTFWAEDVVGGGPDRWVGPVYEDSMKEDPLKDLNILSCFPTEVITEQVVRWLEMARPTYNAKNVPEVTDVAAVAAASVKPYSALGAVKLHENPLKTLAHMFASTQQAMNSWPRLMNLVNESGRRGLLEKLAAQALSGDAAGNADEVLVGLLNTPGITEMTAATNPKWDVNAKVSRKILSARTAVRVNRFAANKAIMNSLTLEDLLAEAESGQHVNPFYNPVTGQAVATIHGLEIVETEDAPDNKVVVGAFNRRTAAMFTSGNVDARFTDSHSTHFAENIVDWRFEMMVFLAIICPQAFCELTLNA